MGLEPLLSRFDLDLNINQKDEKKSMGAMGKGEVMEDQTHAERLLRQFANTFGNSASALLDCRHWVAYIVGPELKIKHFLAGNTDPGEQNDYERHYAAMDPLAPAACLADGCFVAVLSQRLREADINHGEYRRRFLTPHGIVDALEIFLQSDAGLMVGCSLLRHSGESCFTEADGQRGTSLKSLGDFALSQAFPQRQVSLAVIAERFPILTARETMLIQLVSAGLNNKQLCKELNISLPTVKTHLLSIFRKMGVNNRTELAAKVLS